MLKLFKKIAACCAAAAAAVSLCGCGSVKLPFVGNSLDFNKSYSVNADISCDKLSAKAEIIRYGDRDWQFTFTEPKELNGVVLSYGSDSYMVTLGDLNFKANNDTVYTLLPKVIGGALDLLAGCTSESFVHDDGVVSAELDLNGDTVTVNADEKGNLISLKSPHHRLSVNFSGQQAYKSPLSDEDGLVVSSSQ